MEQLSLKITGKVQGVFYRAEAGECARRLGVTGYAKNMPDGSVEVLAQGERDSLEQLAKWCKDGPAGARVEKIKELWMSPGVPFDDFKTE